MPDMVALPLSEGALGWSLWPVTLTACLLATATASLGCLAGKRRAWIWALRSRLGFVQVWALVFGPGLKLKLMVSPFGKGLSRI